jgi:hypothetical protein
VSDLELELDQDPDPDPLFRGTDPLPPRPPYRMSKPKEKPSALKREHPALKNE